MKKNIKYLWLFATAFIFILLLCNTEVYAGSQTLNNLTYAVQLNEDGSADVTETWNINVYNTNTLFKTFEKDSSKYGEIIDVTVQEINTSGKILSFIKSNEYAYYVEKGYYYALDTSSTEFEIAWGVSISGTENKIYQISYTITDAIKTYNDCSEFYWQFIGDTNGIPANEVYGTIRLPSVISTTENLKVWAHGPLNGEIQKVDNQTISFEVNDLSTKTMLEVRIVTTENIFVNNTNIVNSNKLNSIIEEETEWANKANEEKAKVSSEQKKVVFLILFRIVIAVIIAILVCKIINEYIKNLKSTKKIEPEEKMQYYREIPDIDATPIEKMQYYREIPDMNATPIEAAFLYYFDKPNGFKNNLSQILSASILDLALTNAITFEKNEKNEICIIVNKVNVKKINESEREIYELLKYAEMYVNRDGKNKISMKDIKKYAKVSSARFLSVFERMEQDAINEASIKNNYYKIVMNEGILGNMFYKKKGKLTQKGANEKEKWEALKRYMEDFSMIDDREVPELVLWEKYLVYATAFGIADKVLKQLAIKYPEITNEDLAIRNGYSYLYMINNYNFDRILTKEIQNAYMTGRRASSSNFSSGWRKWRRLLRRRRTAEEAGGRNGRQIMKESKYLKINLSILTFFVQEETILPCYTCVS